MPEAVPGEYTNTCNGASLAAWNWNRVLLALPEKDVPAVLGTAPRPAIHLVFSRWVILLLATAIVLPWIVVVFVLAARNTASKRAAAPAVDTDDSALVATSTDPPPQKWTAGKAGPWGRIESMLFAIDVPDEFIPPPPTGQPPIRWFFPDHTKDKVLAALRTAGVSEDEVKKLDSSAKWSSENGMTTVEPGDRLIVSLRPRSARNSTRSCLLFPRTRSRSTPSGFGPTRSIGAWKTAAWRRIRLPS